MLILGFGLPLHILNQTKKREKERERDRCRDRERKTEYFRKKSVRYKIYLYVVGFPFKILTLKIEGESEKLGRKIDKEKHLEKKRDRETKLEKYSRKKNVIYKMQDK